MYEGLLLSVISLLVLGVVLCSFFLYDLSIASANQLPRVGPGQSPTLFLHFPTFYLIFWYLLLFCSFLFFTPLIFLLFHSFLFYQNSPTPYPGAGCCKRRLNLALVFLYVDFVLYVYLVRDACLFFLYLI